MGSSCLCLIASPMPWQQPNNPAFHVTSAVSRAQAQALHRHTPSIPRSPSVPTTRQPAARHARRRGGTPRSWSVARVSAWPECPKAGGRWQTAAPPTRLTAYCSQQSHAPISTDFKSIPLIDIGPLVEKIDDPSMANDKDLLQVIRLLDDACKEAGFFYVKGHGIAESMMREVRNVTREFFQLPYEEKLKIKMTPQNGYRGYQILGENITKGKLDMHEAIDCYTPIRPGKYGALSKPMEGSNLWPEYPSNFEVLLDNYINLCGDLSRKIMRGIALALGGAVDAFEGETAGDPFWVLRLIGYPVDIPEEHRTDTGCGPHTDYGLLTLVNQDDDICALEVQNFSGEWIYATPIPGTFVCNIGDMLEVWSNGIYQPTIHRVVNSSPRYRISVAFFYESNFDAAIEPVEFCREKTGGVAKYEKVVYGEHLVQKVKMNFVM